jgi:ribonuclease HII
LESCSWKRQSPVGRLLICKGATLMHGGRRYGPQTGPFRRTPPGPDFSLEADACALGFLSVCGVDEAGRGPLAGPVVASAVILPASVAKAPGAHGLAGLNDSKQLSEAMREQLFAALCQHALIAIASVSARFIDSRNIRKASLEAMRLAVFGLPRPPDFALVDGKDEPPGLPCAAQPIIKGDGRSLSIAAASICAKVTRDRMMDHLDGLYPGYGFAQNKGYPTPAHRDALGRLGPSPVHRRTFGPVRAALMQTGV